MEDPERHIPPFEYSIFLLMDILHLKKEEVLRLNANEYHEALFYSWTTYNLRRPDLIFRQKENKTITEFDLTEFKKKLEERKKEK